MPHFIPAAYKMCCPTCQNSFTAKHLNSRYCSSVCKIWANNTKARNDRKQQKPFQDINVALLHNRTILRGYTHGQIVAKEDVLKQGYEFGHFTHQVLIGEAPCLACYDSGFIIADNARRTVKIIFLS
jgi:hypothetical protein